MPMTRRSRCSTQPGAGAAAFAASRRDGSGCMCETIVPEPAAIRRVPPTGSRRTAKASIRGTISRASQASCRPTPMPASRSSTSRPPTEPSGSARPPAGHIFAGTSRMSGHRPARRSPRKRSRRSARSTTSSGRSTGDSRISGSPFVRGKAGRGFRLSATGARRS